YDFLPRSVLRRFPDDGAVLFLDAIENVWRGRPGPAVRENRVGKGEFRQGDFAAAEEGGRELTKRRFDAGVAAELNDGVDADSHPDPDRGAVLRFHQRLARGHRPFVTVVLGFGAPFAEDPGRSADHDGAIIER